MALDSPVVSQVEPIKVANTVSSSNHRANLVRFASLLFNRMSSKYGGSTTLNEIVILNYGFLCQARGEPIYVMEASRCLGIPKSTVSRILTGMRAKGFVTEQVDSKDRRRRIFRLKDTYLNQGDSDIQRFLDWCARPENALA